ncbi:MAG: amino acid ABC transporter permease [Gaiellales bacterium]
MLGGRTVRVSKEARTVAIATFSTLVVFGAVAFAITRTPGWGEFRAYFFDGGIYRDSFPDTARAFLTNVKLALVAELFILPAGLLVAVLRSLSGPVFLPFRLLAIAYTDFFRGVPTVMVVIMLGFGMPALGVSWLPLSAFFWAALSLVLVYTAYVSEVYRAGIESVHPSQEAAARSIGLTRLQGLRFVVIPQAVRRVIPPLLNDFIGLSKDTALVAYLGVVEAFRQAQIDNSASFNGTPYVVAATLFLVFTIPLTRFTDWLVARDRRRQQAGRPA